MQNENKPDYEIPFETIIKKYEELNEFENLKKIQSIRDNDKSEKANDIRISEAIAGKKHQIDIVDAVGAEKGDPLLGMWSWVSNGNKLYMMTEMDHLLYGNKTAVISMYPEPRFSVCDPETGKLEKSLAFKNLDSLMSYIEKENLPTFQNWDKTFAEYAAVHDRAIEERKQEHDITRVVSGSSSTKGKNPTHHRNAEKGMLR